MHDLTYVDPKYIFINTFLQYTDNQRVIGPVTPRVNLTST